MLSFSGITLFDYIDMFCNPWGRWLPASGREAAFRDADKFLQISVQSDEFQNIGKKLNGLQTIWA